MPPYKVVDFNALCQKSSLSWSKGLMFLPAMGTTLSMTVTDKWVLSCELNNFWDDY